MPHHNRRPPHPFTIPSSATVPVIFLRMHLRCPLRLLRQPPKRPATFFSNSKSPLHHLRPALVPSSSSISGATSSFHGYQNPLFILSTEKASSSLDLETIPSRSQHLIRVKLKMRKKYLMFKTNDLFSPLGGYIHTHRRPASYHQKQTINSYSGCPSAAELSRIWSFVLEFPPMENSNCEQGMGLMSINDNSVSNFGGAQESNSTMDRGQLHDKRGLGSGDRYKVLLIDHHRHTEKFGTKKDIYILSSEVSIT